MGFFAEVTALTMAPLNLGDDIPDFECETHKGPMKYHEYIEGSMAILFSHPADFTPVCTTELGSVAKMITEFDKRGVKVAALSCNDSESHKKWVADIVASQGLPTDDVPYPIISDPDRSLAVKFGMIDPDEKDNQGLPMTCRAVLIIGADKKLKLQILYPATTGRNFGEVLRVIDSLQLTAKYKVAAPANWKGGDKCMVVPSLSNDDAKAAFPKGFEIKEVPSGKEYIRLTPDPRDA